MSQVLLEVCIDSVESAIAAESGGAQRVELCAGLSDGGLTPSLGMIEQVLDQVNIEVMVIIRPRGGDFLYGKHEWETIRRDIRHIAQMGVKGIVFGALLPNGTIDKEGTQRVRDWAGELDFTFHRAFDMTRDPFKALEDLIHLGVPRILSSGQAPSAVQGRELLGELQRLAGESLSIMAGGGITPQNVGPLLSAASLTEIHSTCWEKVESNMKFRQDKVYMGKEDGEEYGTMIAKEEIVKNLREQAQLS